jgi:hypothetical protein
LAHGVQHHDQQGDHSRPYATPTFSTLKKLGFEEEKGQMREWMTVARDRPAWDGELNPMKIFLPGLSRIFAGTELTNEHERQNDYY